MDYFNDLTLSLGAKLVGRGQSLYLRTLIFTGNDELCFCRASPPFERSAKEYLDMSNLKEHAKEIHILNHVGNDVLKKMTDYAFVESIIKGLYSAKNADLTNKEYEAIGKAQSEWKSYQLQFNIKDGTQMTMYIIPELKVVSMGDAYYQLPDAFFDQSGDIFSGLKQEALPLY